MNIMPEGEKKTDREKQKQMFMNIDENNTSKYCQIKSSNIQKRINHYQVGLLSKKKNNNMYIVKTEVKLLICTGNEHVYKKL